MDRQREIVTANAEKFLSQGNIEAAIKEYHRLLNGKPSDVHTLNRIGDLWMQINRPGEAVKAFSSVAEHYAKDGFFLKAIAIYKKINKLDPSQLEVYANLADLYARMGLAMEAKGQYQVLADYYLKHDDVAGALTTLEKIADLDPKSINVHVKLADVYSKVNRTADALKEYDQVGRLLLERGMFDEAIQVLRKALKIKSANATVIAAPEGGAVETESLDAADRSRSIRRQISELEVELRRLNREVEEKGEALIAADVYGKKHERQIQELEKTVKALNEKQQLAHLLTRVGDQGQKKLLESDEFRSEFRKEVPRDAFVLSIDIRRSTELMLKAREPKLFAKFIIKLAAEMRQVLLDDLAIFDKFTGDGVLAFFPTFYSGEDAGYLALRSAARCHEIFASCYAEHRDCFVSILKDTGLGIGLDYGNVQIVQLGGDFTVVGTPVVYACRMAGGAAGSTWVNQPAYEKLLREVTELCDFEESEIDLKSEGRTLSYRALLSETPYTVRMPSWAEAPSKPAK